MFRMPRWFLIFLLIVATGFTIAGIFMVASDADGGWPVLLFFALCTAIFAVQLRPQLLLARKPEAIETLLQRFPGPVELQVPQRKTAMILIGAIVFSGICLWVLHKERPDFLIAILLWACVAALVLSLPFVIYQLVRGAGLKLEAQGFRVVQPWRTNYVRWTDASEFGLGSTTIIESNKGDWSTIVTYDDALLKGSKIGALNQKLVGRNSSLPDSYGLAPEELQTLMNGWRERSLRGG